MDSYEAQRTCLLVIDDDKKLCRLIQDYLEPLGYAVVAAHSGKEGLEKALAGKFDAVLLDIMMPEMDGLEVLRRLRAVSSVPVLMLTGLGEEPDRIVGLEIGADDYLPKTCSHRELLARLRAVLRRSDGSRSAAAAGTVNAAAVSTDASVVAGELSMNPATRV